MCPEFQCETQIPDWFIRQQFKTTNSEMIEKMLKFRVRWQVENDSDILYCPTPDCQFMYEKITQEDFDGLDPKEF